jgi:sn-glycerol 3-phosphate transport system ATP-binding protein
MATLQLEGLRKSFGETAILQGIDLTLHHGEMLVIVGASGCGKSTLLRLVAGLETATAGRILLDDRDITRLDPAARDIAMVFQNYALYPHMTVAENMAYGLRIRGMPKPAIAARVQQTADLLGLGALLARRPRQLSGGQRQRVAMGRAIVREPKLFLFDEPLSNLDASLRVQMRAEIRQLQRRLGVTSLYVTHDQVEAMTLGDRLLVLHQGVPVQFAPPMEIFERPATTYVAGFIGAPAMNFLSAVASGDGRSARLASGHELALPQDVGRSAAVTLGIRPETLVHGHLADGTRLLVKQAGALPIGDALSVAFPAAALHLFGGDGRRI